MRKTLETFFRGNIRPSENQMTPNSDLQRAVDKAARCEKRLTEQLGEPEKAILDELVRAQHDIDSITACEHFIMGFRLGVRMMAECMDKNDGDIQEISEHA